MSKIDLTAGVPDPLDPARRLVTPWPVDAGFCDVVAHFLLTRVPDEAVRQLAYWEAYQDALKEASTDGLTGAGAWHWHDDMVRCVDDCVAVFRAKARNDVS